MVDSIPDSVKTIHRNLISTDFVDYVSRRKSKYYLAQCRDNVSEWSQMSSYTRDNMSEWSQMSSYKLAPCKFQPSVLVYGIK